MSRASEIKGIRDKIDEVADEVSMLDRVFRERMAYVNRQLDSHALCYYCQKRDFTDNMTKWGGHYWHEACRLENNGLEVCSHCDGKGVAKKPQPRPRNKGKGK